MVDPTSLVLTGKVTAKTLPQSKARLDALITVRIFIVMCWPARKLVLAHIDGIDKPRLTLSRRCIFERVMH